MAISLKHLFQSAKTDGPDNTIVQPSDWNDEHVLTQATNRLLGRTTAGAGATEEIAPGTGITLSAGTLSADVTSVAGRTGAVTLSTADISGLTTGYVQKTSATGSAYLPAGTTGQREGSPSAGYIRYNTTTGKFEGYGSAWGNIGGGASIGDTPPANPGAGDLWWNSADGRMYVYYTDANSSQWVDLSAGGAGQYLPLTGGTVTGAVNVTGNFGIGTTTPDRPLVVSGNNATLGIYATNGGNLSLDAPVSGTGQINIAGANAFRINTNSVERFRVDASGRVTIPAQPSFSVTGPYTGNVYNISTSAGVGYVILWQGITVNNGSYYTAANGRFTAPVAGQYVFQLSIANSGTTSGPVGYIRKNGSAFAVCIGYQSGTGYNTASVTSVVTLAANDYVDAYFIAFNQSAAIDLSYSNFTGWLIG